MDNKKNLIAKLLKPLIGFLVLMLAFEIILFELLSHGFLNTLVAMIIQIIVIAAIFGLLTSFILSLLHPFLAAIRGKEAPANPKSKKRNLKNLHSVTMHSARLSVPSRAIPLVLLLW